MIRVAERVNPQKYGRLLSRTLPAVIKTEKENDRAILLVEKLVEKGDKISLEENALLDLLWSLIADFEEKFYQPRDASQPVEGGAGRHRRHVESTFNARRANGTPAHRHHRSA